MEMEKAQLTQRKQRVDDNCIFLRPLTIHNRIPAKCAYAHTQTGLFNRYTCFRALVS